MKNLITFHAPVLGPMPGEITNERVNAAIVPPKIEALSRAIAACTDLPELLKYKQAAEGLAAAVRILKKDAPQIVADANRMVKTAIIQTAILLREYSPRTMSARTQKSERGKVAESLGLSTNFIYSTSKIGRASKEELDRVLAEPRVPNTASAIARFVKVKPYNPKRKTRSPNSISYNKVMSGTDEYGRGRNTGLGSAFSTIKNIDLASIRPLAHDEKKLIRAKVTEIMELLDAIDEACK